MDEKIKELAKKNQISVAQARELYDFPFRFLKEKYIKLDVLKEETTKVDFLYNNFITIKLNKKKLKKWTQRISSIKSKVNSQ